MCEKNESRNQNICVLFMFFGEGAQNVFFFFTNQRVVYHCTTHALTDVFIFWKSIYSFPLP